MLSMARQKLVFGCALYDRVVPLAVGQVKPAEFDLDFVAMDDPRATFDRMGKSLAFDASEMSSAEFIVRMSAGDRAFVAIPAFVSRVFRHGFIVVNRKAGIRTAKDLEGKRVGVPLYTMTAAVWIRGHLQHEYGVDLGKIHWIQGAVNDAGTHGSPYRLPLPKPPPVEINASGKSLNDLLVAGEIDAIAGAILPEALGRHPDILRLFPNYQDVEMDFYRRTKIFPIMHVVVIRRDVYEKAPSVAAGLYDALCESKSVALARMRYDGATRYMLPWMSAEIAQLDGLFGADPWPYGIAANRPSLDALLRYLFEQSMLSKPMAVEDLFVPGIG
jgi:4,5-dihydroxyphthalate decarboxylase